MYNSEHGQDLWLNEHIFNNKYGGTFVEFGAIDGIITSNTLFFELFQGWNGLCVEPIPEIFEQLIQNRKCFCENYAISNHCGQEKFLVYDKIIGWSGLSKNMEAEHFKRMEADGGEKRFIQVDCIRLNTLLEKYHLHDIDYMSIDVEGAEALVIGTIDFNRFKIGVIDIENNYGKTDIVEPLLNKKGFTKIARLEINDIYRRNDYYV